MWGLIGELVEIVGKYREEVQVRINIYKARLDRPDQCDWHVLEDERGGHRRLEKEPRDLANERDHHRFWMSELRRVDALLEKVGQREQ